MNRIPIATLIHISDLHFGDTFEMRMKDFKPSFKDMSRHDYQAAGALALRVNQILKDRKTNNVPAVVVFTGDLTRKGQINEFKVGNKYLRSSHNTGSLRSGLNLGQDKDKIDIRSSPNLVYVPGNHDIFSRKNPMALAHYLRTFPGPYPKKWEIVTGSRSIFLLGVDSNQNTSIKHKLARGFIISEQVEDLIDELRSIKNQHPDSIRIVLLHHTLVKATSRKWILTMELDGRESFASQISDLVHLVLSGHVHDDNFLPKGLSMPNQLISGTAIRLYSKKSFMLIDIFKNEAHITPFYLDRDWSQFVPECSKSNTISL